MGCVLSSEVFYDRAKIEFATSRGCVVQPRMTSGVATAVLIVFCHRDRAGDSELSMTYHDVTAQTLFAAKLTNEQLAEQQKECGNTHALIDVFGSLVNALPRGEAQVSVSEGTNATITFDVMKRLGNNKRARQPMRIVLPFLMWNSQRLQLLLLEPLRRGAAKNSDIASVERDIRRGAKENSKPGPETSTSTSSAHPTQPSCGGSWTPAVSVDETETQFHVRVDLPGVDKEDVTMSVSSQQLLIRGTRVSDTSAHGGQHLVTERGAGDFERRFDLPSPVRERGSSVTFANGVLKIVLEKAPRGHPPLAVPPVKSSKVVDSSV